MRRAVVIFAAVWFLALGTGLAEYAHNAEHAREDARNAQPDQPSPVHDESNCAFHALLNAQPLPPAGEALVGDRPFVALVTELDRSPVHFRVLLRIDCRGPPRAC